MAIGFADYQMRIFSAAQNSEQLKIDVTAVDSIGTFSQEVRSILIYNTGPNVVHFNEDAVSTVDNFEIPAKAWFSVDIPVTHVHLICAAAETATCYVIGLW